MEINQKNAAGQCHGYWEQYYDNDKKQLWYKGHLFNDHFCGYAVGYDVNGQIAQIHLLNSNDEIGCVQYGNSQRFCKTPGEKFGEEIKWK